MDTVVLPDVNVLVYAHRKDSPHHDEARRWLEDTIASDRAYAYSELVVSAFVQIVTHPRVFDPPSTVSAALAFASDLMTPDHAVPVAPGPRHWEIFEKLCRQSKAKGNMVSDAYLAALAIESGSQWVSTDGDFARFDGLVWTRPF
jgi:toxin-antitoxin system PIN domain toxin